MSDEAKKVIDGIIAELKADNIAYLTDTGEVDPIPVAPRLLVKIANWDGSDEVKKELIDLAIEYAGKGYTKVSGLPVPNYDETKDFNKYWRNNKIGCKVDRAILKPIFMTLRDALSKRG